MKHLILIAGMYRSGSTWLYNVTRIFLEKYYSKEQIYSCFITDYNKDDPRPIHIVKTHEYSEGLANLATLIILSERGFDAIAESMYRFHGMEYRVEEIEELCSYYYNYLKYPFKKTLQFKYDSIMMEVEGQFMFGKYLALLQIMTLLDNLIIKDNYFAAYYLKSGMYKTLEDVEALLIPDGTADYADPLTLLHPNHKTA